MDKYLSIKIKVISFMLIIMVVYIHSYNNDGIHFYSNNVIIDKGYNSFLQDFFSLGINQIANPLFFSISGYLFFLNTDGKLIHFILKIIKRFRTLVIPYLFWSIGALIFYYFLQSFPISNTFFTHKFIRDYSVYEILNSIFIHQIPVQLWFLRDLFILVLLSPVIYWLIRHFKLIALLILTFAWFTNVNFLIFSNEAFLFFTFGSYFCVLNKNAVLNDFSKGCYIYFYSWIAILLLKTVFIYYGFQGEIIQSIFRKMSILFGIMAVWSLYDSLFRDKELVEYRFYPILSFSFFIFAFHEPMLDIIKKGLFYIMGGNELVSLFIYIVAPLLTIFASIFIGYYLKHFVPKFYGIITGNR
jgi:surface polysaccharide O-acyltransferase-like enzyme